MNNKERPRIRKHRPKIYDDSKPKVSNSPKTPKPPTTPKKPKAVAPNKVLTKSQNSINNEESCKRSLFAVGKSDKSGKIATSKSEENGRQDIRVYQRRSKINSKAISLFTPAFEVYKRTIKATTTLGEQEAAQYDTSGPQDEAVEVPNSVCEGEKAHCGHDSGVVIKQTSRKRRNEGLDMNKRKSPRVNIVSKFETLNSLTPRYPTPKTITTPETPKPLTPNRVQNKCKRSLNFEKETGQKYFHVFKRRFKSRSNAICLVTPAFEFYRRRNQVYGKKDILVYRRSKKPVVNKQPKLTANVDLDNKSLRVWKSLMANGGSEPAYKDKDEWWQEQGEKFGRRIDSFLEKMRVVQGNMRFSLWKGSVTDSVVGAYLTQNVTDHLSSSAFMSVAARFPPKIRNNEVCFNVEFASSQESVASTSCPDASRTTQRVKRKFCGSPLYDSNGERILKREKKKKPKIDWDELRKSYCEIGVKEGNENSEDAVDWDAVMRGPLKVLSKTIEDRGMHNKLAKRIKVDFLERIYKEHGSLDLEWLRNVPPHKAKEYLLSFYGLGLKSVECIRLLTLHHLAFPVDTNVARVATRLGWVPLQSLPDDVPIHHLNAYPPLNNIQKYLFPRLCTLDKEKLYELHCHLITFGKVFCSKKKPNCTACPMKAECLHYASAFPSRRLAISGSKEGSSVTSIIPVTDESRHSMYITLLRSSYEKEGNNSGSTYRSLSNEPIIEVPLSPEPEAEDTIGDIEDLCSPQRHSMDFTPPSPSFYQEVNNLGTSTYSQTCEPIVEVPPSPKPKAKKRVSFMTGMEDLVYESDDDNGDDDGGGDDDGRGDDDDRGDDGGGGDDDGSDGYDDGGDGDDDVSDGDDDGSDRDDGMSKALALASVAEALDLCKPKKFSAKWRTMHLVYELPKDHPCLAGFEAREQEDPTPYLLALWFPGEDRNSSQYVCNRRYILNKDNGEERVQATVLIPCRTANRGSFPLNGTYFQANEVFADDETSLVPLQVPRNQLINLQIRILGCGTSTTSIHRGLSTGAIQSLFCTGSICVRGFNRKTRKPKRLRSKFHSTRRNSPK